MSDDAPATQTGSQLVPPIRRPPTAVATGELPPPAPRRFSGVIESVRRVILDAMDVADALVEAIQGERR